MADEPKGAGLDQAMKDRLLGGERLAPEELGGDARMLKVAEETGKAAGTMAARAMVKEELARMGIKGREAGPQFGQFENFLLTLKETVADPEGDPDAASPSKLVLSLRRLENNGGPRPLAVLAQTLTLGPAEAVAMDTARLDEMALEYCQRTGRFGRYQWRLQGTALGEALLDTTYNVTTEAPPGYVPPEVPKAEREPVEPPRNPMEQVRDSLGLLRDMAGLVGLGGAKGASSSELSASRSEGYREGVEMGKLSGRMEAHEQGRRDLDALRERLAVEQKEAVKEAEKRGRVEGAREKEDELRPRMQELEKQAAGDKEPSLMEQAAVSLLQSEPIAQLVAGFAERLIAPKPAPAEPKAVNQPAQGAPPPAQVRPLAPKGVEPSREELFEAQADLRNALTFLEGEIEDEESDQREQAKRIHGVFQGLWNASMAAGPLAPWWAAWTARWNGEVHAVLEAFERKAAQEEDLDGSEEPDFSAPPVPPLPLPPPGPAPMDFEALKQTLRERLDAGVPDAAILEELRATVPPGTLAQWKGFAILPAAVAAKLLGAPQHTKRLRALLKAFQTL